MSSNDYKRNRSKRTYGYERQQPVTIQVVENGVTKSLDHNQLVLHRDFYIIFETSSSLPAPNPTVYAEYDEDFIHFNWQDTSTRSFNISFTANPTVVLVLESEASGVVNPFLLSRSTTELTVGLSAQYSGAIRYRAINSNSGYPALVQRNVLEPSLTYTAYAGFVDVSNSSTVTASYAFTGPGPDFVFLSPYNISGNDMADVWITSGSAGTTDIGADLSAETTTRINFLAVK
jgi:hypothetical protein